VGNLMSVTSLPARMPSPEPLERLVVLVLGDPGELAWRSLRRLAPHILCVSCDEAGSAVMERADAVFVWDFRSRSLTDLWPAIPQVMWVHAASAGVDHLLFPELIQRGALVTNSSGVFEHPIAEYVLGLVLMHAKGFAATLTAQREHRWAYRETSDIQGQRLLIIGLGRIGREVARLATACGMRVSAVRSRPEKDVDVDEVFAPHQLIDAVREADFVVITVARTPETQHLIDGNVLAAMKRGAYLVNVARGEVLDTVALVAALESGHLAGAALDVFDHEPLQSDDPLWSVPNLVISPHMSADSTGWDERVIATFAENAQRYLAGMALRHQIDTERGY
jgi:phosphoglycerate dehydrogenase-like enzyme